MQTSALFLYNLFLKYGLRRGKPFKRKQQFDEKTEKEKKETWERVAIFFNHYDYFDPEEFFDVVYSQTPPTTEIANPLSIFSQKNIALYIKHKKQQRFLPIPEQINWIRSGFQFLVSFCRRQNLKSWIAYLQQGYTAPTWLQHYKEFRVSPYNLLVLPTFVSDYLPALSELDDTGMTKGIVHDMVLFNEKLSCFPKKAELFYLAKQLEQRL